MPFERRRQRVLHASGLGDGVQGPRRENELNEIKTLVASEGSGFRVSSCVILVFALSLLRGRRRLLPLRGRGEEVTMYNIVHTYEMINHMHLSSP